jgi:hypothetical protein
MTAAALRNYAQWLVLAAVLHAPGAVVLAQETPAYGATSIEGLQFRSKGEGKFRLALVWPRLGRSLRCG